MNNLKNKILIILISILSVFSIVIVISFNASIYGRETTVINQKIMRIANNYEKYGTLYSDTPFYVDEESYVVKIDLYGNTSEVIHNSTNSLSDEEVLNIINKKEELINSNKLGFLYTSKYVAAKVKNNCIIVINIATTKKYLVDELLFSLILLTIAEIGIINFSLIIAKWIVSPVEEAFEKQKQFIYDASHELKTPIAIIAASAETLENNPKEKKWLNNIKEENDRMNKLVAGLLNLSKSENIKENEEFSEANLSKLIETKALAFESLLFENELGLDLDIEKDIKFNCNADRIKELLSILVDNAIKHSDKKSKIKIKLNKEKHNIILSVTNKGKEIPIEERDKIFERFYRIDKSRNRNANRYGLGLSIAKNIVINHNGSIKVECENGFTTFYVNFK